MRCLALAEAFDNVGESVVFCCASLTGSLADRIRAAGHQLTMVSGPAGSDDELRATQNIIREVSPGAVVLDGYQFADKYREEIARCGPPVLAFDDFGIPVAGAKLILNTSPAANAQSYSTSAGTRLLLGPKYALVRRDVLDARSGVEKDGRILVTFGGTDPIGLTLPVAKALTHRLPGLPLHVVIGGGVENSVQIRNALSSSADVQVDTDLPSLGRAIALSGLVVSSAGTTIFEIAAIGRPMVLAVVADNQAGAASSIGQTVWADIVDVRSVPVTDAAVAIAEAAAALWHDEARAESFAARAMKTVDGNGAQRVKRAILETTDNR